MPKSQTNFSKSLLTMENVVFDTLIKYFQIIYSNIFALCDELDACITGVAWASWVQLAQDRNACRDQEEAFAQHWDTTG